MEKLEFKWIVKYDDGLELVLTDSDLSKRFCNKEDKSRIMISKKRILFPEELEYWEQEGYSE